MKTIILLFCLYFLSLSAQEKGIIYLTFDDGPINATANLLPILNEANVKATFFINGFHLYGEGDENEDKALEALKELMKDGHVIANHSYDHMLHNCSDGKRSGAAYCNEVGLWPVGAYGDPLIDFTSFPENRIKIEALYPGISSLPNYKMDEIYRLPYTNSWRVSDTLNGDALCATTDSLLPWDADYRCVPEKPSQSVQNAILIADMLAAAGKHIYGWDVDWGPTNWGVEHPAETMKSAEEIFVEVEEALKVCTPSIMTPLNSRCHTLNCDSPLRKNRVVILSHDFLFENSSRGKGADINLPKLKAFIGLAKSAGYRFETLESYR